MTKRPKRPQRLTDDQLEHALLAPQAPPSIVEYRTMIVWKDGVPFLTSAPERLSQDPQTLIPELLRKVLDLPYGGNNPAYVGLSYGEAMVLSMARDAADGSSDARDAVLDRLLGKPKQKTESVELTGDLNDFLDRVAAKEFRTTIEVPHEASEPHKEADDL